MSVKESDSFSFGTNNRKISEAEDFENNSPPNNESGAKEVFNEDDEFFDCNEDSDEEIK
jgi:hypothetical protein